MAGSATRSYRLTMSDRGLSLFLQCHFRFCSVANGLRYDGHTLHAAGPLIAGAGGAVGALLPPQRSTRRPAAN
mgnify:CR=1 FL=1